MSHKGKVVLRVVTGLLAVCAISVLVIYVVLRPVRAVGPGGHSDAEPETESDVALPDPASVYCEEKGYRLESRTTDDGSQYAVCIFPDGGECEEWAFYRGECGPEATSQAVPVTTLALKPDIAAPGQTIQVFGRGFVPGVSVVLRLGVPNAGLSKENLAAEVADASGAFAVELTLPTEWPGAQTPIVERELVIAAVDETRGQTVAVAQFTNEGAAVVECFDGCTIFARDAALEYLAVHYGDRAPAPDLVWEQRSLAESIAPEGSSGAMGYEFVADGWVVVVSYPIGGSGPVVYAVAVTNQGTGFQWQGTVDTHANVTE